MYKKFIKIAFVLLLLVLLVPTCNQSTQAPEEINSPNGSPDTPQTPVTPPAANSEKVSFLAFGDWGTESDIQRDVATAIGTYCQTATCQFVMTLGDNFQDAGVQSTSDPLWQTTYRDFYSALNIPFYASLGNHDTYGNIQAQVDYSAVDTSWHMLGEYYSFTMPAGSTTPVVEYFIINSGNNRYDAAEETWLEGALAASTASWKFLISHKPILSNGDGHGDTSMTDGDKLISDFCGKIDFVLSGHDHIFSYLVGKSTEFDVDCTVKQLVIGTGGSDTYGFNASDPRAIKTGSVNGFGWFEATANQLTFKMIKSDGTVFHETSWMK